MSALVPVLAVSVFSVCLFHALPAAAAENRPRSECSTKPADIVFLLDSSGSVGSPNFDKAKEFLKQFVKSVKIGPKNFNVGVVTFDSDAINVFSLNNHTTKSSLLEAIDTIPYNAGITQTYLGLEFVREAAFTKANGDRDDANNILIVVTDGVSANETLTADQANKLHKTDIKVIAIGVGLADQKELKTIASEEESVFEVTNFDALKSIQEGLKAIACAAAIGPVDAAIAPVDAAIAPVDGTPVTPTATSAINITGTPVTPTANNTMNITGTPVTPSANNTTNITGTPVSPTAISTMYTTGTPVTPTPTTGISTTGACVFGNFMFHQNQMWRVGCAVECICDFAWIGHFTCYPIYCVYYWILPPNCRLVMAQGECCPTLDCNPGRT